jgi:ATP-dependent Clp protease ATP-binding subunit ClpC
MTSNIGTGEVSKGGLGFRADANPSASYHAALRKFFRPEFLNRLDDIIVFNPLTPEALFGILELNLADLRERLAGQGLSLALAPQARDLILSQGHDPTNGARPLRRAIERLLTRPLSSYILENRLPEGTAIQVGAAGLRLTFTAQRSEAASEA